MLVVSTSELNASMTVFAQPTLQNNPSLALVWEQCSVVLNDLVDETHDVAKILERLSRLMDHVDNLERAVVKLAPLSHLIDPETQLDKRGLVTTGNFLDVLRSNTSSRVDGSCKVVVFYIPHRIHINGLIQWPTFPDQISRPTITYNSGLWTSCQLKIPSERRRDIL